MELPKIDQHIELLKKALPGMASDAMLEFINEAKEKEKELSEHKLLNKNQLKTLHSIEV